MAQTNTLFRTILMLYTPQCSLRHIAVLSIFLTSCMSNGQSHDSGSAELPIVADTSTPLPPQGSATASADSLRSKGSIELPDFSWQRVFPDANSGWVSHESVAAATSDSAGNVYITGTFWGTLPMGMEQPLRSILPVDLSKLAPPTDIFVSKLDNSGLVLWSRSYGDGERQWATATTTDNEGGIYIAGGFAGTLRFGKTVLTAPVSGNHAFVAKLRSCDGTPEWAISLGNLAVPDSGQTVTALLHTRRNGLTIVGNFTGTISGRGFSAVSAGSRDIFLLNLSEDSGYRWFNHFGGASNEIPVAAATSPDGKIILSGYYGKAFTFGTKNGLPANVLRDPGSGNIFLAAFSPSGEHIFSKSFGDHRRQELRSMSVSDDGKIVITGPFSGTIDFGLGPLTSESNIFDFDSSTLYVAAFDEMGAPVWQRTIGHASTYQKATSIAFTRRSEILISGGYTGFLECEKSELNNSLAGGTYEQFILKLTDKGECVNLKGLGDSVPWGAENNTRLLYFRSIIGQSVLAYGGSRLPFMSAGKDADATIAVLR